MAQLTQSNYTGPGRSSRNLKSLPKVDLTAMVDLAFLLITFFMLTTSLSKPVAMELAMPVGEQPGPVPDNRTMTICLGSNHQALAYMGTSKNPQQSELLKTDEIRAAIKKRTSQVVKATGKGLIVLIKPDDKSKFKDLVDLLDELSILNVPSYAIVNIGTDDKSLLMKKGIR